MDSVAAVDLTARSEDERGGRCGLEAMSGAGARVGLPCRPDAESSVLSALVLSSGFATSLEELGSSSAALNASTSSTSSSSGPSSSSMIWLFRVVGRGAVDS